MALLVARLEIHGSTLQAQLFTATALFGNGSIQARPYRHDFIQAGLHRHGSTGTALQARRYRHGSTGTALQARLYTGMALQARLYRHAQGNGLK